MDLLRDGRDAETVVDRLTDDDPGLHRPGQHPRKRGDARRHGRCLRRRRRAPERLIAALRAGNEAGGDSRGEQSAALADLGFYDGDPGPTVGDRERDALESFQGMNNFENHPLPVVEDALARGWTDADSTGEERLVNAPWHGLSRLDRV